MTVKTNTPSHLSDISAKISTVPAALAFLGVYRPRTLASFRAEDNTVAVWYRNGRDSWASHRVDVIKFTEKLRWRMSWSYDSVRSLSVKLTALVADRRSLVADRRSLVAEMEQLRALTPSTGPAWKRCLAYGLHMEILFGIRRNSFDLGLTVRGLGSIVSSHPNGTRRHAEHQLRPSFRLPRHLPHQ